MKSKFKLIVDIIYYLSVGFGIALFFHQLTSPLDRIASALEITNKLLVETSECDSAK